MEDWETGAGPRFLVDCGDSATVQLIRHPLVTVAGLLILAFVGVNLWDYLDKVFRNFYPIKGREIPHCHSNCFSRGS